MALPWAALTALIYVAIIFGGLVESWGRDHTPTLRHYIHAFGVTAGEHGLVWSGTAWNSFWTTLQISAVAAVPTTAIGLLTAWLLVRQEFGFKRSFEFATMLSFAIPGTVIGVAYVLAFNVPPIELTGTGIILVVAFVFRNMPVGVRAGIANMSQLDRSLDEASLTLRASNLTTVRRIVLPLLRPAILAGAGLQLRARDDRGQRRRLPGQRQLRDGDHLHPRPGRERRLWPRDRLLLGPDPGHAGGDRRCCSCWSASAGSAAGRRRRWPWRGSRRERAVERPLRAGQQDLRQRGRRQRGLVRDRGRQSGDAARPLRLRQDHDAAHDRRPGAADLGPHLHRRAGGDPPAGDRARRRDGVPVLRPVPAHDA